MLNTSRICLRLTLNKHILVSELGDFGTLVERQVLEAAGALHTPLLLRLWCHCDDVV